MDTKYLNYFITIAEEKNMRKAAKKLFVSQSSLSYYLSKLENEIGTNLFLRNKNELTLTPAGRLYLEAARSVVSIKDRLYQNILNLDNRNLIRISTTSLWGNQILADIIPKFQHKFPDVFIRLSQIDDLDIIQDQIRKCDIDFGLLSVASLQGLEESTELLRKEEVLFAVPTNHPYTKKNPGSSISQEDLAHTFFDEKILISRKTSANRQVMDQLFMTYMSFYPPESMRSPASLLPALWSLRKPACLLFLYRAGLWKKKSITIPVFPSCIVTIS